MPSQAGFLFFDPGGPATGAAPLNFTNPRSWQCKHPKNRQPKALIRIYNADFARPALRALWPSLLGSPVFFGKKDAEGLGRLLLRNFQLDAADGVSQEPVHSDKILVRQATIDVSGLESPFRKQRLCQVAKGLNRDQLLLFQPVESVRLVHH